MSEGYEMSKTYGSLSISGPEGRGSFLLEDIAPHVSLRIKQLFPRVPVTRTGSFTFPLDDHHCLELDWLMQRYPFAMDDETARIIRSGRVAYQKEQDEIDRIMQASWSAPEVIGLREGAALRRYQSQAVEVFRRVRSMLLGDMVGLGKTFTAAGAMLLPGTLPAAVVVEPNLVRQWQRVIESFTTLRVHAVTKSRPYELPEADIYIFRYGILGGWTDFFTTGFFRMAVYDEIQSLRAGDATVKGSAAAVLS